MVAKYADPEQPFDIGVPRGPIPEIKEAKAVAGQKGSILAGKLDCKDLRVTDQEGCFVLELPDASVQPHLADDFV